MGRRGAAEAGALILHGVCPRCSSFSQEQLLQSPNMATQFHATLQELLKWVRQMEEVLAALPPPSYILDTVSKQRRQQQVSHSRLEKEGDSPA